MASAPVSNSISGCSDDSSIKKKNRKSKSKRNKDDRQSENSRQWKCESQQKLYSSKLAQVLSQISLSSPSISSAEAPRRRRAVREAADRVLATAARGRTRWSRAILTNRPKYRKHKRQKTPTAGNSQSEKLRLGGCRLRGKCSPAVQRKVKVLGRLVPGCRKEPLPVILEEVTDYIAALEMQVRAMSALAGLLSGDTSGPGTIFPLHR